jgi:shikimate kinase
MQTIFLIGFMGSGKTTLGKQLAEALQCDFLDSDREIERRQHSTISQLFAEKGEMYFRQLEREFILGLSAKELQVVAVGGGLPCYSDLIKVLKEKGRTIYLKTNEGTLYKRLAEALEERPLIEGMGEVELRVFIERKLAEREPFYLQAEFVLTEEDHNVEKIIQLILPLQKS